MFEINVGVEVRLSSGAKIELTEEQNRSIKNFVIEKVLGKETPKEKRVLTIANRRQKRGRVAWTIKEREELKQIVLRYLNVGKGRNLMRAAELKAYRNKLTPARSRSAVAAEYHRIKTVVLKEQKLVRGAFTGFSIPVRHG